MSTKTIYPISHNNQRTVFKLPACKFVPKTVRLAQFGWTISDTAMAALASDPKYDRDTGAAAIIQRISVDIDGQNIETIDNAFNLFGLARLYGDSSMKYEEASALTGAQNATTSQYASVLATSANVALTALDNQVLVQYKDRAQPIGTETIVYLHEACGSLESIVPYCETSEFTISIEYVAKDYSSMYLKLNNSANPLPGSLTSPTVNRPVLLFETNDEYTSKTNSIAFLTPIRDMFYIDGAAGTLTLNSVCNAWSGKYLSHVLSLTKTNMLFNKLHSIPQMSESFQVLVNDQVLFPRPVDSPAAKALITIDTLSPNGELFVPFAGYYPLIQCAVTAGFDVYDADFKAVRAAADANCGNTYWSPFAFAVNQKVDKVQFQYSFPADTIRAATPLNIELYGYVLRTVQWSKSGIEIS